MTNKESKVDRRTFLSSAAIVGASGALGAGGLLTACSDRGSDRLTPLRPVSEYNVVHELPDKAIDGKPIKAVLIGCGARGTGAAINFLEAGDGLSVVALADVFQDKIDICRNELKEKRSNVVTEDRCFVGFDAYIKACKLPEVDMAIIASPSIFHPEQTRYAIEQGKHVFVEKPACIDAVGYRAFMTAVRQAQSRGLCVVTGTQRHHQRGYIESYKKVQEGYIGRIVSGNVYWNQASHAFVRRQPGWTDMEYMIRDFFGWNWLCGDHIIDQGVHNIDVFTWFSHLKPTFVIGMGSRLRRIAGNIYDNFSADIEYEGGVHLHAMARQIDNCHSRVAEIIHGTKGSWSNLQDEFIIRDLDGNIVWKWNKEANDEQYKQNNPYVLEHVDLVNHIRKGTVVNFAETTAISSFTGAMARESAYTGRAYEWDESVNSDMNLMPEELHLGNVPDFATKFVSPLPGTSLSW